MVAPLGQVLAEINDQQNVKDNTTEEGQEMSTEDFAQLSREEQLKVNGFKSKTNPLRHWQKEINQSTPIQFVKTKKFISTNNELLRFLRANLGSRILTLTRALLRCTV